MIVPKYERQVGVQNTGTPTPRLEPMIPASSPAGIHEAAADVGATVTALGAKVAQHMVMQEKLAVQQENYATGEKFKRAIDTVLSDPEKGLLVKYKGVNATKAVPAFDEIMNGAPASLGTPEVVGLRQQFLKDRSPDDRARLEKIFASTESLYRGKLINHALREKEAADKAVNEANIDAHMKTAALVTPTFVNDPGTGKLIPSVQLGEQALRETITNDAYFKMQGLPKEKIDQIAQDSIDKFAKTAVESNVTRSWQDAQAIADASGASEFAKKGKGGLYDIINGARLDQYTEGLARTVVNDPSLRDQSGEIDEFKAIEFVNAEIAKQDGGANPLPPGNAGLITGKVQSQINIFNKAVTQRHQFIMAKAANDIYKAQQGGMDPKEAYDKFIRQGVFDNALERAKAEDIFTKVYEKDPNALDTVWAHMTPAQKTAINTITNSKDFMEKFPYADERRTFENSMKQRIIEGRIQSIDGINKLYQEQLKEVPTGAARFFGLGTQMQARFVVDESLQRNPQLVRAVGGLHAAAVLAQGLGGPDKLAPDTNEAKAVMAMKEDGYDMFTLNAKQVQMFMRKYPDRLK